MPSQDVWKFTPVSYRTLALWGHCPAVTLLFQLIISSRASGTADHVRSLDDLLVYFSHNQLGKVDDYFLLRISSPPSPFHPRRPRVIVTAVLGDRKPAELHLFRNYDAPVLPGEKTIHVLLPHGKTGILFPSMRQVFIFIIAFKC